MSLTRIDQAHSMAPRLDILLMAQQRLKGEHRDDHMEFEVDRGIEALAAGEPTSHTECVERWARKFLDGAA